MSKLERAPDGYPALRLEAETQALMQREYLDALKEHKGRHAHAVKAAGTTLMMVSRWREDPDFQEEEQAVLEEIKDDLRKKIDDKIDDGSESLLKEKMKTLPEYNPARKSEVHVTGQVNHAHAHLLANLTDEERDRLLIEGAKLVEKPKGPRIIGWDDEDTP